MTLSIAIAVMAFTVSGVATPVAGVVGVTIVIAFMAAIAVIMRAWVAIMFMATTSVFAVFAVFAVFVMLTMLVMLMLTMLVMLTVFVMLVTMATFARGDDLDLDGFVTADVQQRKRGDCWQHDRVWKYWFEFHWSLSCIDWLWNVSVFQIASR
jgi:hypothetical protein